MTDHFVGSTRNKILRDFARAEIDGPLPGLMAGAARLSQGPARTYLSTYRQEHDGKLPRISEDQANRLLDVSIAGYAAMARARSTGVGCAGSCATNPISEAQFDAYGRGVRNVLADLAYNSGHYAFGRENVITDILRNANGDDVAALQGLRSFINGPLANARNDDGEKVQSVNGQRVRTAYIDEEIGIARETASAQQGLDTWLSETAADFNTNGPAPPPTGLP